MFLLAPPREKDPLQLQSDELNRLRKISARRIGLLTAVALLSLLVGAAMVLGSATLCISIAMFTIPLAMTLVVGSSLGAIHFHLESEFRELQAADTYRDLLKEQGRATADSGDGKLQIRGFVS